jgi:tripartite motif-containing protein 71
MKKAWASEFELSKSRLHTVDHGASFFLTPSLFPSLSRSWSSVRAASQLDEGAVDEATSPKQISAEAEEDPANKFITNLDGPIHIAQMKNKNFVVAEWRGNTVSVLGSDGQRLLSFGPRTAHGHFSKEKSTHSGIRTGRSNERHGSSPGEFLEPTSVLVTQQDHIIVVDSKNHRLQSFTSSGIPIDSTENKRISFNTPYDICSDSNNRIYISDTFNHNVKVFTENFRPLQVFGQRGSSPGKFEYPLGIAADDEGMIYVCDRDNSRVQKMTHYGKFVMEYKREGYMHPVKVAADGNGDRVYVSYNYLPDVAMFDGHTGNFLGSITSQSTQGPSDGKRLMRPRGIMLDDSGQVYVCNVSQNEIWVF